MKKENNLTPIQTEAITHLLDGHNLKQTCLMIGKAESTMQRWMKQPEFSAQLSTGRTIALLEATNRLTRSTYLSAVELERLAVESDQDAVRLNACKAILEFALRLSETCDLATRIAILELKASESVEDD